MTLSDIPALDAAPDGGTEGVRFAGYPIFDPLVNWDLSQDKTNSAIVPGLATEWYPAPEDHSRWIFKLRQGVKFHDGSPFNADAVIFNFERGLNKKSPDFDAQIERQLRSFIPSVNTWKKLDDYTIEISTGELDSSLPYQLTRMLIASPARFEKVGRSWAKFRQSPSGTGPWKFSSVAPRQRAEFVPNKEYWDKGRVPKLDKLVLMPLPEVSTRTAALLSGQVDWVESPSPDSVDPLKKAGMVISTNTIPHSWPYTVSFLPDSPFHDIRVRKAINLAIDRDGLVQVLHGLATPAIGNFEPGDAWWGNPSFSIRYDPEEAKKLLKEAGYGPDKPLNLKIAISTAGSGQMYPLIMNEFIQENLRAIGVNLQFQVLEWEALRALRRGGAISPDNKGIHAINNSWSTTDPYNGVLRFVDPDPPQGSNWGFYKNEEAFDLVRRARAEFDPAKQDELLARIHKKSVDDAIHIWIVHDVGSRALSPRVKGHIHAKSWFVDFSSITMQ